MYNSITEDKIRSIPPISVVDINRLPQELTRIFAKVVALRKKANDAVDILSSDFHDEVNLLKKLALNLETLVAVLPQRSDRESAAFVSATAHYLLLQIGVLQNKQSNGNYLFTANSISSGISSILLFLIGNSPADAAEVARFLENPDQSSNIKNTLLNFIKKLATGSLKEIADLDIPSFNDVSSEEETAERILWEDIAYGLKNLAKRLLGENEKDYSFEQYIDSVINLSKYQVDGIGEGSISPNYIFAGPHHLAKLLKILGGELSKRSIVSIPSPSGINSELWVSFLKDMSLNRPYLWDNHVEAIGMGFLEKGVSSILTFPTGAGKSTLSELKIASTLFDGKSVIYLVPTHALEDQTKENLKKCFGDLDYQMNLHIDAEYTELNNIGFPQISVMTPERCLTLLSLDPEQFHNIGLVVFDEFHLIHGKNEGNDRRSIDAMLCLLQLFSTATYADYLLISAMVENGSELAGWITKVTGRQCFSFSSCWKPTRQMHSCIVYQEKEVSTLNKILKRYNAAGAKNQNSEALKSKIKANPYAIFSLRNIWESNSSQDYYIIDLLEDPVQLSANKWWYLTPNRNEIAADLAANFSAKGFKTLVFVDIPKNAYSTAKKISNKITNVKSSFVADDIINGLIQKVEKELGSKDYAFFSEDGIVGVHHGNMLPEERRINESLFKSKFGLNVIVATPTLAQGINLPAEIVIIAGDDRYDKESNSRKLVDPHEILNAAGRAGRAGMASQGAVFVVPSEIVTINEYNLSDKWWKLKNEVFSKSDQCLIIKDPLEYLLDNIQSEAEILSAEFKNLLYRLQPERNSKVATANFFGYTFAAYQAERRNESDLFLRKVDKLVYLKSQLEGDAFVPTWVENVSIKMGVDPGLVQELGDGIDSSSIESMMSLSINDTIQWILNWLSEDDTRIIRIFGKLSSIQNICKALNLNYKKVTSEQLLTNFLELYTLTKLWMSGENLMTIETQIHTKVSKHCDSARNFTLKLIPDLSFVFGIYSMVLKEKWSELGEDPETMPLSLRTLASIVREGVDSVEMLAFRYINPSLSRIQCHEEFSRQGLDKIDYNGISSFNLIMKKISSLSY